MRTTWIKTSALTGVLAAGVTLVSVMGGPLRMHHGPITPVASVTRSESARKLAVAV